VKYLYQIYAILDGRYSFIYKNKKTITQIKKLKNLRFCCCHEMTGAGGSIFVPVQLSELSFNKIFNWSSLCKLFLFQNIISTLKIKISIGIEIYII